jgi:hypothetical protein
MHILNSDNPPHLDRQGRNMILEKVEILSNSALSKTHKHRVATGIVLLWNDYWEDAHLIAQAHEGESDYDLLHAMVHRREVDLPNSGYWYRSAGAHPSFDFIGSRMQLLLAQHSILEKLVTRGKWNPIAFNDAVKRARTDADLALLRSVQAEEMRAYFDWLTQ